MERLEYFSRSDESKLFIQWRPANDDDHVLCLPQTKVTPPSTTSNSTLMNINKKKNSNEACETQNPSKQVLIGWDDERCRPIYRETSASSSGTCSSTASTSTIDNTDDETESQDDENGFRKEDDCSDVKDEHMGELCIVRLGHEHQPY